MDGLDRFEKFIMGFMLIILKLLNYKEREVLTRLRHQKLLYKHQKKRKRLWCWKGITNGGNISMPPQTRHDGDT